MTRGKPERRASRRPRKHNAKHHFPSHANEREKCACGVFFVAAEDGRRSTRGMSKHLGWYSRDYLPHFDKPGLIQGITFRLADSMPAEVIARWRDELAVVAGEDARRSKAEFQRRIADYLDAGHGECLLRDDRIAQIVEDSLLHFDGNRYRLLAWAVMPNHVHALAEMHATHTLAEVVHSWKSFTAHEANRLLGRTGEFWQREYHDRYIRDGEHLEFAKNYIEQNPVKARLCAKAEEWQWGSARRRAECGDLERRASPPAT